MIHNRQSTGTSVGATIGTFDPVNTRNGNNLLPSGCTGIYGMTYVGSRVAFTAALSKQTRLRITHPASGFNNDDFLVGAHDRPVLDRDARDRLLPLAAEQQPSLVVLGQRDP